MNKKELKKILRPLIKECIKEVIFEEGTLSTIISEVVKGTGGRTIVEESPRPTKTLETRNEGTQRKRKQLQEQRKKMLNAIGRDSYNGVDLFEGTTPLKSGGHNSQATPGILEGVDPSDPGVDLSQFGISKDIMKKMMGK
tara:strand:+ start:108 stop:527 length:420 start_codon:yes stop_codon:yes gene_type:complete